MKRFFLVLLLSVSLTTAAFAQWGQRGVTIYAAKTDSGQKVRNGAKYVLFDLDGFSGTIGNVTFSNKTKLIPVKAEGLDTLGEIVYSVSSGTLNIVEVR